MLEQEHPPSKSLTKQYSENRPTNSLNLSKPQTQKYPQKQQNKKREPVFKEDGQEYAQVLSMLGNDRCEATCTDQTKRIMTNDGPGYSHIEF